MQEQKQEDILLNSERRALMDEIAELKQRLDAAWASNNRRVNRIILTADYLDVSAKDKLLEDAISLGNDMEGFVIRTVDEFPNPPRGLNRWSFKVINNNYKD